jgi:hypothetical protein
MVQLMPSQRTGSDSVADPMTQAWAVLAQASAAVVAASEQVWQCPSEHLLALLKADQVAQSQRDAARLALICELDARGTTGVQGRASRAVTTAVLLAHTLTADPSVCAADVVAARCLTPRTSGRDCLGWSPTDVSLPRVGRALSVGQLTRAHAGVIVSMIRALPATTASEQLTWAEEFLVAQACKVAPRQLRRLADRIRHHVDPDGVLQAERDATERATLWLRPGLGGVGIRFGGQTDAVTGAQLKTFIDAHSAPVTGLNPETGDKVADRRTADQRRGAAFGLLVRTAVGADDQTHGGVSAALIVTIPYASLVDSQVAGAAAAGAADVAVAETGVTETGFAETGVTLSAAAVRRLACDAQIIPLVLGANSEPLDIGRATRIIATGIRRALIARDRGCAFPGCDRPSRWADAHHIRHWSQGGSTALTNLVLLCPTHHDTMHYRPPPGSPHPAWSVRIRNGQPEFTVQPPAARRL